MKTVMITALATLTLSASIAASTPAHAASITLTLQGTRALNRIHWVGVAPKPSHWAGYTPLQVGAGIDARGLSSKKGLAAGIGCDRIRQ